MKARIYFYLIQSLLVNQPTKLTSMRTLKLKPKRDQEETYKIRRVTDGIREMYKGHINISFKLMPTFHTFPRISLLSSILSTIEFRELNRRKSCFIIHEKCLPSAERESLENDRINIEVSETP